MAEMYDAFREMLNEVLDLRGAAAVLRWDQQTYMPPGGAPGRARQIATLERLAHIKFTSDGFGEALERALQEVEELDPESDERRMVHAVGRLHEREVRVPGEWVGDFYRTTSLAQKAWEEARRESDFSMFRPHLEAVVELRRQYTGFFAPYDHVYDPLLDRFEPGLKTAEVRGIFDLLRPEQVDLVSEIIERGPVVDDAVLHQPFDVKRQWEFGMEVLRAFGYDFEHGRQDESAHPFTISFWVGDVRITTRFDPNYIGSGLFSSMHEAGHALYDQGIDPTLDISSMKSGASLGVHESQSRMWENLVGRSRPFWRAYFPRLQETFPQQLGGVDLETFYRAINKVERSLIRVEADEATYNLHIMLRFELEVALMQSDLEVADLPEAWNEKVQAYLGLTPPDDARGVLQDIHWSDGYFGYFPTYALGNLIAAQLWETIQADMPGIESQIEQARFGDLLEWLREHIHRHGAKFEPMELVERATGHKLTPEPYLRYLRGKFGEIYGLPQAA